MKDHAALMRARILATIGAVALPSAMGKDSASDSGSSSADPVGCLEVEEAACPTVDDANAQFATREKTDPSGRACAAEVWPEDQVATNEDGRCCYVVHYPCESKRIGCAFPGRPLHVERVPAGWREADTWFDRRLARVPVESLPGSVRSALAEHWARIGAAEHESIAAFNRSALELLACGAPARLVAGAQRAGADEVRHATIAFTLASQFAGCPVGPRALDVSGVLVRRDLLQLALDTVRAACIEETLSTALLLAMEQRLSEPVVKATVRSIRRDEDRHVLLAWSTARWALETGGATTRAAMRDAFDAGFEEDPGARDVAGLQAFGLLRPSEVASVRRSAFEAVVRPCAAALLAA